MTADYERARSNTTKHRTFKVALALLLCLACIPVQSLTFAKQAWAATGDNDFYFVLYEPEGQTGSYDLVLQSSDEEDGAYGTKVDSCSYDAYRDNVFWNSRREDVKRVLMRDAIKPSGPLDFLFYGLSNCVSIDLGKLDTSSVTNMVAMFSGCSGLASLDLSPLDTSRVWSMDRMFSGCSGLTSLDLSPLDTSGALSLSGMFAGCSGLASLDLSGFDASSVENTSKMFEGCDLLFRVVLPAGSSHKLGQELPSRTWTHESGQSFTPRNFPEHLGGVYTADLSDPGADKPQPSEPGKNPTQPPVTPGDSGSNPTPPSTGSARPALLSLARAEVTVKARAYTGKTLKPSSVSVKVGGRALVAGRDFTFSCKGGKKVGSYKATVIGKGTYTGTKTATFDIVPKGTSVVKAKTAKRGFTVSWKKPSKTHLKQTTGYKVQWSTDKKFKRGVKSKLVKKNKTTSLKVSKLKGGKRYYVRVCSYKKVGGKYYYSAWSKAKAVKTKK